MKILCLSRDPLSLCPSGHVTDVILSDTFRSPIYNITDDVNYTFSQSHWISF